MLRIKVPSLMKNILKEINKAVLKEQSSFVDPEKVKKKKKEKKIFFYKNPLLLVLLIEWLSLMAYFAHFLKSTVMRIYTVLTLSLLLMLSLYLTLLYYMICFPCPPVISFSPISFWNSSILPFQLLVVDLVQKPPSGFPLGFGLTLRSPPILCCGLVTEGWMALAILEYFFKGLTGFLASELVSCCVNSLLYYGWLVPDILILGALITISVYVTTKP